VSALLGTDQISGADERSSVLIQSSDDRLTEVRSKPVANITAFNNQDGMSNIFTFNRRYNPNNTVHRCQPSHHWNRSTIPLLVKNGRHQAGEGFLSIRLDNSARETKRVSHKCSAHQARESTNVERVMTHES
jgi:hypothetical protein